MKKNFEILVSKEKGFTPDWVDHNTFTPDEETARATAASIKNDYRHIIILDLKKCMRIL